MAPDTLFYFPALFPPSPSILIHMVTQLAFAFCLFIICSSIVPILFEKQSYGRNILSVVGQLASFLLCIMILAGETCELLYERSFNKRNSEPS